jgi:hypothetical protein
MTTFIDWQLLMDMVDGLTTDLRELRDSCVGDDQRELKEITISKAEVDHFASQANSLRDALLTMQSELIVQFRDNRNDR